MGEDIDVTRQIGLTHIAAPEGVAPGTSYTQVITGSGRLVAVSGQFVTKLVFKAEDSYRKEHPHDPALAADVTQGSRPRWERADAEAAIAILAALIRRRIAS